MSPPHASSSSEDVMKLPRVPRVRSSNRTATREKGQLADKEPRTSTRVQRKERKLVSRSSGNVQRGDRKRKRTIEAVHSDDDENEEESEDLPPVRRITRIGRRTSNSRKIVEEDDEDEEDDGDDDDEDVEPEDHGSDKESESEAEEDSRTPQPVKKKAKKVKVSSSESNERSESGSSSLNIDEKDIVVAAQKRVLEKLEHAAEEDSDHFDSGSEQEREVAPKKVERLTRRQRAMQGEHIELEYTKLESPKAKKASPPEEEWSNDEEAELKKQQRARLRQMIHEKRNKEKRAAMVDKVLRGVTSKRKKLTLASEERMAKVGNRLRENEMRDGCIRFISNQNGISVSVPRGVETPQYLSESVKAVYPRACTRDPKTGKRVFKDA